MAFSIILTESEKKLAESYSKLHNISLDEAFKNALFEKIEDEFDLKIADIALAEYKKTGESRPINELWEELNL